MKKSLLALAALTAFAGVASAQSSVTLFGVVDVNVRSVDNDNGARTTLSQDGNASSRVGLRGIEDMGGGLRAGFWLEGAINPDTGTPTGQTWQRRSTVSLLGGFGEVRLGRDYTATFWNHTVFDPFGTNGVGAQTNLMTQQGQTDPLGASGGTLVRANNMIAYFLPAMGGLYGQVQFGFEDGSAPGQNYFGGRIGYAAGPINIAAAYGETKEVLGSSNLEAYNFGGSFNFGFMTLMGQYHNYSAGPREMENFMIGATVPLGSGTLKASYAVTSVEGIGALPGAVGTSGDSQMIAVGYVYDLSKRTALYTHYSVIDNDQGVRFVVPGGKDRWQNGSSGFTSQGLEFGVRHSF